MPSPNEQSIEEQCFEGPEKNLQVIFTRSEKSSKTLRNVKQDRWQIMLNLAKCQILHSLSNKFCTAYILSESSLFVYDDRIILKTCGATPLLYATDEIIRIGSELNLRTAAVLYWRKNFNNPQLQDPIHRSFSSEVSYLDAHFGGENSSSARLGSHEQDHFHFYYSELVPRDEFIPVVPTFEIKMHELHPCVSEQFFWNNDKKVRPEVLNELQKPLPNFEIDEYFFTPCGYSMNALDEEYYETIHITPEDCCSYMSFETSDEKYINTRIKEFSVMELFRPASCTTIQITPNPVAQDSLDGKVPNGFKSLSTQIANLGSISVVFHSYQTIMDHPMVTVAKLRQDRIALIHQAAKMLPF